MSTRRKPKVGETVLVQVDARQNNGFDVAPALVTAVNEVEEDKENDKKAETRVNARVFLDTGANEQRNNVLFVNKQGDVDVDDNEPRTAFWSARD